MSIGRREGDLMSIDRRTFLAGAAAAGTASLLRPARLPAQQRLRRYARPVIDAHFHWYPQEFVDLMIREGPSNGVTISGPNANGEYRAKVPGADHYAAEGSVFNRAKTNFDVIFKAMDERSVDMYALTMTHPHLNWAPPEFGLKLARVYNDAASATHLKYPKRLLGTMLLPMQAPKLAVQEMERAAKLPGIRALNLAENINGTNLGDKSFWPVYEKAEALGLPIFLKNINPIHYRLIEKDYTMLNVLGNPFEATIAATSLMLSGALDAFPKLDFYLPHAGGFFAFVTPRIDWSMGTSEYAPRGRTNSFKNLKQLRASDYRRRFHYDLILHDPRLMRDLIDIVGADRVACGTDFPQGMAIMKPVEYVEAIPNITQRERELILCENPARLLKV